jgi:hypothetical protein
MFSAFPSPYAGATRHVGHNALDTVEPFWGPRPPLGLSSRGQDRQKPIVQLTREQKPEQNKYSGNPSVSPDSQSFDISAAW